MDQVIQPELIINQEQNFLKIVLESHDFDHIGFYNELNYITSNEKYLCEIEKYTESKYSNKFIQNDSMCLVCLSDIEQNTQNYMISCGHYYHKKCISDWLDKKKNCPLCRKNCMIYNRKKKVFEEDLNFYKCVKKNNEIYETIINFERYLSS